MTGEKKKFLKKSLLAIDVLLIINAYNYAYILRNTYFVSSFGYMRNFTDYFWVIAFAVVIIPLSMAAAKVYVSIIDGNLLTTLCKTIIALLPCVMIIATTFFLAGIKDFSRLFFILFVVLTGIFLIVERLVVKIGLYFYFRNSKHKVNVLVIGTNSLAEKFTDAINRNKAAMVNIIGYVSAGEGHYNIEKHVLGSIDSLEEILKNNIVDEVVFALPRDFYGSIQPYVIMCEEMGLTINMMLDFYNLKVGKTRLGTIGNLPVVTFYTVSDKYLQLFFKRVMDIIGAIVGLIITAIAYIFIAPAICHESPGPVFFSQQRMGKNGRVFKCYKFRSMYVDAEERKKELMKYNEMKGNMFKIKDDPRITRVGKSIRATSLDELPQFWNVLKGDMSLVGTRPPTVDEYRKYELHHKKRLAAKPGLTGMWQISGRSDITDFEEVVRLDTEYIANFSLGLYMKILLKTFVVVLGRKGSG